MSKDFWLLAVVASDGRYMGLEASPDLLASGHGAESTSHLRPRYWNKTQPGIYRIGFDSQWTITDIQRIALLPMIGQSGTVPDPAETKAAPKIADDYAGISGAMKKLGLS